jgi:thiamine biosynthesis lipoprotein
MFVSGCGKPESLDYRRPQFLMGSLVEITVFEKDENKAELTIQNTFNEIQRLEGLMSTHISGPEVYSINQTAGVQSVPVSPKAFEVIE